MRPNGYIPGYADAVGSLPYSLPILNGTQLISTYITVATTGGTIVYKNQYGNVQVANAFVGRNPISAIQILSSSVTQFNPTVTSTTNAVGLGWEASAPNG